MSDAVWTGSRQNLNRLLRKLPRYLTGELADPTGEVRAMYERLAREWFAIVHEAYEAKAASGPDDSGMRWDELAKMTLRLRRQKGVKGDEILIESHRLEKSLAPGGGADQVLEFGKGTVTMGTSVPYADKHMKGGVSDAGHPVPARRLWPEWDQWPQAWRDRLTAVIADGTRRLLAGLMEIQA